MPDRRIWDLAIVGSGAAGIAAAIEAAERGMRPVVLEAHSEFGGAARISGGGCCIAGTPLQRDLGIEDSVELAYADWLQVGGPTVDREWAKFYLDHAVEDLYLWAEHRGVQWAGVREVDGNSAPRWHHPRYGGPELMAALYAHARTLPIDWRFASPVTELAPQDDATWRVLVDGGDDLTAAAVIVAAGGFSNDSALLSEHLPALSRGGKYLRGGAPQATGAGYRLLRSAGAAFEALDAICLYPIGTPHPDDPTATRGVSIVGITNVWLNSEGRRFHDEAHRGMADTPALVAQPGASSWGIFDKHEVDRIVVGGDADYKAEYVHGVVDMVPKVRSFIERSAFVRCAATIEDLARAAGLPVETAVASVRRFNELIAAGAELDDFGRQLRGLRPIADPPFYAIQYFPWVQKCLGGARTDLGCRVLRPDGSAIPGLYAAGEVAGMAGGHINGRGVLEGTMIAPSLFAGRVAARSIHEARL